MAAPDSIGWIVPAVTVTGTVIGIVLSLWHWRVKHREAAWAEARALIDTLTARVQMLEEERDELLKKLEHCRLTLDEQSHAMRTLFMQQHPMPPQTL